MSKRKQGRPRVFIDLDSYKPIIAADVGIFLIFSALVLGGTIPLSALPWAFGIVASLILLSPIASLFTSTVEAPEVLAAGLGHPVQPITPRPDDSAVLRHLRRRIL